MSGSFDDKVKIREFDGGINTKQRKNKIDKNQQSSLINMDFSANSARRAKGYERLASADDDVDKSGKSLYKHTILDGQEVLIKVIGGIIKYLDEVDDKWYRIIDKTYSKRKRWAFETFNGYLYTNNGEDNWIRWNGSARSRNQNKLDSNSTKIELKSGHGSRFPGSGTVLIQGLEIDYSSKNGDELEGININQTIETGNTVILQADDSFDSVPKAKDLAYHNARMYMIEEDNSNIVRHSKLADNKNPEDDLIDFNIAGSGTGDAGFGILPDKAISLKEYIEGGDSSILAVLVKNGVGYSFSVTDSGNTTTNNFIPLRTMNTYPAARQMAIIAENDIAIADNVGHIRALGYGDINTPLQVRSISEEIEPSIESIDFSVGDMVYYKRKLYVAGANKTTDVPDTVFFRDAQYESWGLYDHWDVISFAEYKDKLVGLSTIDGKVWELEKGYSADGKPYSSEMVTKEFDFKRPHVFKEAIQLRLTGLITETTKAKFEVFFDNENDPTTFIIDGSKDKIILSSDPNVAIGNVVFGEAVYGGGLPGGTSRREFYGQAVLNSNDPFLKTSLKIRLDGSSIDFELNDLSMFVKLHNDGFWQKKASFNISN